MLPKFLIADNSQEAPGKLYVVHTQEPRFIIEASDEDFSEDQIIHWIDNEVHDPVAREELVDAAEKFVDDELDSQEDLYDHFLN